ncbi:MAG: cyclic nucleotide-binding domain-containing protein [Pseudomonadota bacterium]
MTDSREKITIGPALSTEERDAVYRFRYRIYVEEMDRYRSIADHETQRLYEPDDQNSHIYHALLGDEVVGTMRLTWGGDGGINARHVEQYDLRPFLSKVPEEQIVIGERFMIEPSLRGSNLLFRLFTAYLSFVNERRIQLVFGDCEPHLLNVYQGLGFRPYTKRNVNSSETGYLVPLVLVPEDLEYLRQIESPIVRVMQDFGDEALVPDALGELLADGKAVLSQRLISMPTYWAAVANALTRFEDGRTTLFDELSDEEIQLCLAKSNVIECSPGDRVIKKGNVAQNMFVVLCGTLEVRAENEVKAILSAGDMFGDIAFFLGLPRTLDVYAATDDVSVISLSESTLRSLMENEPKTAAKLLQNIAKMLCFRVVSTN